MGQVCRMRSEWLRSIVFGSSDRTIRVWNVNPGAVEGTRFTRRTDSVIFLPQQMMVSVAGDLTVHTLNTNTDSVMIDDGWLRTNSDNELLLWVPSIHRPYLHHANSLWIVGVRDTRSIILTLFTDNDGLLATTRCENLRFS
jgi:WD40 repeat protein